MRNATKKNAYLKYLSNKLFTWEWTVSSVALPPFGNSILNFSYPHHLSFLSPMLKGVLMNWKNWRILKFGITYLWNTGTSTIMDSKNRLIESQERWSPKKKAPPEVFIGVLKNFAKFPGKNGCQGLFPKKSLCHRCFPLNFTKFLRATLHRTPPSDCFFEDEDNRIKSRDATISSSKSLLSFIIIIKADRSTSL